MIGENIRSSRIVVLDDSPVDLKFIESILRTAGFSRIECFTDPAKAIFQTLAEVPALLVIDLYLGETNAVEIIAKLRQNLKARFLPIVVISGSDNEEMIVQALRHGADDFISKSRDAMEITIRVTNILNREYYRRSMEYKQKQLEEDIRFAAKLQEKMLPLDFPKLPGFCFDGLYKPYHIASGDFYKAVRFSPTRVFLMLADVSGHGVGATIVAFHMDLMLRQLLGDNGVSSLLTAVMMDVPEEERELRFITGALNERLYAEYGTMGLFAATFLGILDAEENTLRFIAAGSPPLLLQAGGQVRELPQKSSRPLGVMPDTIFRQNVIPLSFDRLLFFTDGIFEVAKSATGEMLDISGLAETASRLFREGKFSLENLYTRVARDFQFNFEDDVTILSVGKTNERQECIPFVQFQGTLTSEEVADAERRYAEKNGAVIPAQEAPVAAGIEIMAENTGSNSETPMDETIEEADMLLPVKEAASSMTEATADKVESRSDKDSGRTDRAAIPDVPTEALSSASNGGPTVENASVTDVVLASSEPSLAEGETITAAPFDTGGGFDGDILVFDGSDFEGDER